MTFEEFVEQVELLKFPAELTIDEVHVDGDFAQAYGFVIRDSALTDRS